jgi:excisionase family DNA binding protein
MGVNELSEYLKLSDSAIYKLNYTSQIPYYKSGKKLYFKKEDIDKWLETKRIKTIDELEEIAFNYLNKKTKRN